MLTKQTDGKFEKWVESGLSTFEIRRLVAEIYFSVMCIKRITVHVVFGWDAAKAISFGWYVNQATNHDTL